VELAASGDRRRRKGAARQGGDAVVGAVHCAARLQPGGVWRAAAAAAAGAQPAGTAAQDELQQPSQEPSEKE
jgi:hypothetical protein